MENSESNNIIAKGSLLKGNLNVPGNIRLEGKVVGNVKSKSKIVCGETSVIEGNVNAVNAEIAGKVNGKVRVEELLILKSSCTINGDILTEKLIIESDKLRNMKRIDAHKIIFSILLNEMKNYIHALEIEIR